MNTHYSYTYDVLLNCTLETYVIVLTNVTPNLKNKKERIHAIFSKVTNTEMEAMTI